MQEKKVTFAAYFFLMTHMKRIVLQVAALLLAVAVQAQEPHRKVDNVTLKSLDGKETLLPDWGEKHLLIFYIDPDRHK